MGVVRLRASPGNVWPTLPAPEAGQVWAAYQVLDRTQWLSPAELLEFQLGQIRELVRHCLSEVPYYRRVLTEAGLEQRPIQNLDDFRRIPLLTRQLYQANAADLRAAHLPPGTAEVGQAFTSGTSGVPIKVLQTNRVGLWFNAFYLRDLEWTGMDPGGRLAALRLMTINRDDLPKYLEGVTANAWNSVCAPLLDNGPAFGMDVRQDPRRQLQWLESVRPDYLLSMPTNLDTLGSLLVESGRRLPGLRGIRSIGEPLEPQTRKRIEAAFGVPVRDVYSTTEGGYMASPCPEGHGLHVHSENILAEVLDAQGRPCPPGQTGRLVFTTLHNFLGPFLRYEILDEVTLAPGPCPCGRGLPLWAHVDGRRHPMLHLPGGGRKSSIGLIPAIRKVAGFHQFQVIQRAVDHVVVRVVPDRTWTPDHAQRIRLGVREEFGAPIRVDVEDLQRLELPPGGKFKMVVIQIEEGPGQAPPGRAVPRG